jgi:hypothetical protein
MLTVSTSTTAGEEKGRRVPRRVLGMNVTATNVILALDVLAIVPSHFGLEEAVEHLFR